jgi:glutamyl-Q tRNA(Asp) synthetase
LGGRAISSPNTLSSCNAIGRFAPSPTGPLHAGSLLAALGSFLNARAQGGLWHLRIDDIDPPRAVKGSVGAIQMSLETHGFQFDGDIQYQSAHTDRYEQALKALDELGDLFHCGCTRAMLGANGSCQNDCANKSFTTTEPTSIRVKVPQNTVIILNDIVLGGQNWHLGQQLSDFVVRRRDGLYAYQLAAAVDDASPLTTQVVRGRDLLDSTPRQVFLQRRLALSSPEYGHLPVIKDQYGAKLSKQQGAAALDNSHPAQNLRAALRALGQPSPPSGLKDSESVLEWSRSRWDPLRVPR